MKKNLILASVVMMLFASACEWLDAPENENQTKQKVELSTSFSSMDHSVLYPADYSVPTKLVYSVNTSGDYKVSVEAEGVRTSVEKDYGQFAVLVYATENTAAETLVTVKVSDEEKEETFSKVLELGRLSLDLEGEEVNMEYTGGTKVIVLDTNLPELRIEESATWFDVQRLEDAIEIVVEENPAEKARGTNLTLTDGVISVVLTVKQAASEAWKVQEREALKALYYALDGDNWNRVIQIDHTTFEAWLDDSPLEKCAGIYVGSNGHILEISLPDVRTAKGELPEDLKYFTKLRHLHMDYNPGITGGLKNLALLPCLTEFWGAGCGFSERLEDLGTPEFIELIKRMSSLDIFNNNLTGPIPEWLSQFNPKGNYALSGNRLEGIVPYSVWSNPAWSVLNPNQQNGVVLELEPEH